MPRKNSFDVAALRERLRGQQGPRFWRSLDELAETAEFQQLVEREFPEQASEWSGSTTRRRFLTLMGASLALAGLSGCGREPAEKIVPYVRMPENIIPGRPLYFATAMSSVGPALGLLVESHMGRPTKVEGNPSHPASPGQPASEQVLQRPWGKGNPDQPAQSGATDVFAQASVLGFYDPDRSQVILGEQGISTWQQFTAMLLTQLTNENIRLRILTETVYSPTLAAQLDELLQRYPQARWHQYSPVNADNERDASRQLFGQAVQPIAHVAEAEVIVSLDADFLNCGPQHLQDAHQFARRRKVHQVSEPDQSGREAQMNRLYVAETTFSVTGAAADHRQPMNSRTLAAVARAIAARLGVAGAAQPQVSFSDRLQLWIDVVVEDLQRVQDEQGASLVLAGSHQPPEVHALCYAINQQLGNVGRSIEYLPPPEARPDNQLESLRDLVQAMQAGEVDVLIVLGGNPAFTAPADLAIGEAMEKVPLRVHMGMEENETAALSHWHLAESHFLETWSDTRAADGTVSIVQPLIAPLYDTKSFHQLLATMLGEADREPYQIVKQFWRERYEGDSFEAFWQTTLHDGVMAETANQPLDVQPDGLEQMLASPPPGDDSETSLELVLLPDPTIWDGRFANNAWLQELPKPITKLTWDNAAIISVATAQRLGVSSEDMVRLQHGDRELVVPVWVLPGHPDETVTLHFGYGRERVGRVGGATGFNAYKLRTSQALSFAPLDGVTPTGRSYELATTQNHFLMHERHLARAGTLEQYREHPEHPEFVHPSPHHAGDNPSLYPEYEYKGYKWGMAIDLTACTGCQACVIACQAENNIPVVGKLEVRNSREMHWLRVDTYYEGPELESPRVLHQPVPCMHCEKAPCELVCPVAATVHSDEGLNDMVYNRCVGTRYCSNNCPYKVRRFNYFEYADYETPSFKLGRNPDVTVRSRGVMEKCTYCVQRINAARIATEKSGERIEDGDVVTACQAACPTQAIVFGDLNDPHGSQVKHLHEHPLNYSLLDHLNTQPRTQYLAAVRNPHPKLEAVAE